MKLIVQMVAIVLFFNACSISKTNFGKPRDTYEFILTEIKEKKEWEKIVISKSLRETEFLSVTDNCLNFKYVSRKSSRKGIAAYLTIQSGNLNTLIAVKGDLRYNLACTGNCQDTISSTLLEAELEPNMSITYLAYSYDVLKNEIIEIIGIPLETNSEMTKWIINDYQIVLRDDKTDNFVELEIELKIKE
jgi:hypothetical protein